MKTLLNKFDYVKTPLIVSLIVGVVLTIAATIFVLKTNTSVINHNIPYGIWVFSSALFLFLTISILVALTACGIVRNFSTFLMGGTVSIIFNTFSDRIYNLFSYKMSLSVIFSLALLILVLIFIYFLIKILLEGQESEIKNDRIKTARMMEELKEIDKKFKNKS